MTRVYAEGLRDHKQSVFAAFQELIPKLADAFPELAVVVRPHPTESQEVYRKIAAANPRVHVTNEGNVVPWLLAAKALIHNGCTTGVEAFVMRIPAISYRAVVNETYDNGFYLLPNHLSHLAFSYDELHAMLQAVMDGRLAAAGGEERDTFVRRYLAAQDGPLASERIVTVIENVVTRGLKTPVPSLPSRTLSSAFSSGRFLFKRLITHVSSNHAPPEFHHHRYPGISLDDLRQRIARFQRILGDSTPIQAHQLSGQVFRISLIR